MKRSDLTEFNEIVKAIKICADYDGYCEGCPYSNSSRIKCRANLRDDACRMLVNLSENYNMDKLERRN